MTFVAWVVDRFEVDVQTIRAAKLVPAFEVLLSRVEEARRRGAEDPLVTVSPKQAGGNSRACTKRMLENLGLTDAQRRAIHRLLAGSPSGWPGLLALYSFGQDPTPSQRRYAQRLLAVIAADHDHHVDRTDSSSRAWRSGSRAG